MNNLIKIEKILSDLESMENIPIELKDNLKLATKELKLARTKLKLKVMAFEQAELCYCGNSKQHTATNNCVPF